MEGHAVVVDEPTGKGGENRFQSVREINVQNKDLAALMGEVDPDCPDGLPGGLMSKLGITEAKLAHIRAKKQGKGFIDWLWQEAFRQSLRQIRDIIQDLHERMEMLLERMAEVEEELAKLDNSHEILKAELEHFQEHGRFDLDGQGRLKNPDAEALVTAWEKETGQKVDRTDPASYALLLQILMELEEERIELRRGLEIDAAEYDHLKEQKERAEDIRGGLESGDAAENREAFGKFEAFMDDYGQGFEYEGSQNEAVHPESDPQTEISGAGTAGISDDFSFGFPPLKNEFTSAGNHQLDAPGHEETKNRPSTGIAPKN